MDAPAFAQTPEAARAEIESIRADQTHAFNQPFHPGQPAAQEFMDRLYQVAYGTGEVEPMAPSGSEERNLAASGAAEESKQREGLVDYTDAPLPEFEGVEWDTPAVTELRLLGRREGLAEQVERGLAVAARVVGMEPPSGEETDRELAQAWGSDFDRNMADAHAAWKLLPARHQRNLMERGAHLHPSFIRHMAEVGATLHDPSTPRGAARMKARYEQSLAKEEAKRAAENPTVPEFGSGQ